MTASWEGLIWQRHKGILSEVAITVVSNNATVTHTFYGKTTAGIGREKGGPVAGLIRADAHFSYERGMKAHNQREMTRGRYGPSAGNSGG